MLIRLLIILSLIHVSGCTTSPTIFGIGANSISGKATHIDSKEPIQLSLKQSELKPSDSAGFLMPSYPYQSLAAIEPATELGMVSFEYSDIKWQNDYQGIVTIELSGESKMFEVLLLKNELRLSHYYRNWYGYPAQSLLVVSYPLDVALITVYGAIYLIGAPFMYLADS